MKIMQIKLASIDYDSLKFNEHSPIVRDQILQDSIAIETRKMNRNNAKGDFKLLEVV